MSLKVFIELAEKIHGKLAARIVEYLIQKGEATDEELGNILHADINEVRRTLNELFESRLLKYRRARDHKIGWYIYFWRITDENPAVILEDRRRKSIQVLQRRLDYERSSSFYMCPTCGKKYTFEEAMDSMFKCIECGGIIEPYDNSHIIRKLEEAIRKLQDYNPLI